MQRIEGWVDVWNKDLRWKGCQKSLRVRPYIGGYLSTLANPNLNNGSKRMYSVIG